MESGGEMTLSEPVVVQLAAAISVDDMKTIALLKMDFTDTQVKHIERDTETSEAFNREILFRWKKKNPGPDQMKVN